MSTISCDLVLIRSYRISFIMPSFLLLRY